MDKKTPPLPPSKLKKPLTEDVLSKNSSEVFALPQPKAQIHPSDLLKNPRAAFIFAEILRPLDF